LISTNNFKSVIKMREDEAKQIVQEIVDGWSKVYIK